MGVIADIEDAVTNEIDSVLGSHIRASGSMPGPWSADVLKRLLQNAPGAYVSWLGGQADDGDPSAILKGRLDVVTVTKNARGEVARRRGGVNEIGAYDMIELLVPALHGHMIPDVGSLRLTEISNVFNESTFDLGATVYIARFRLPVELPVELDLSKLDNFATFRSEHDVDPDDSDVQEVEQDVEIPQ